MRRLAAHVSLGDPGYLTSSAFREHCSQIVHALDAAQASRNFDGGEAKAAVERCARAARAAGVLPEKLIIELKTLMREVALPAMRAWYRSVLTDRVIVWAIEAYYGIAGAPGTDTSDGTSSR